MHSQGVAIFTTMCIQGSGSVKLSSSRADLMCDIYKSIWNSGMYTRTCVSMTMQEAMHACTAYAYMISHACCMSL